MTISLSYQSVIQTARAYAALASATDDRPLPAALDPDREPLMKALAGLAFSQTCSCLSPYIDDADTDEDEGVMRLETVRDVAHPLRLARDLEHLVAIRAARLMGCDRDPELSEVAQDVGLASIRARLRQPYPLSRH